MEVWKAIAIFANLKKAELIPILKEFFNIPLEHTRSTLQPALYKGIPELLGG